MHFSIANYCNNFWEVGGATHLDQNRIEGVGAQDPLKRLRAKAQIFSSRSPSRTCWMLERP